MRKKKKSRIPFTRQTPKTKSIYFINQKLCSTKSMHCRLSSAGESHGRQFPSSKEQPSRAVQLCSLLSLLQAAFPSWRSVTLWHRSQDLMLPTPEGFVLSQDCRQWQHDRLRSYREASHGDIFIIPTPYYSKWYWNNSYTPSPHQTKLTSDRDFWQRMKSRNFWRSYYMLWLKAQLRPTYMPAWFKSHCSGFWGLIIWSLQTHYIFAQEKKCCLTLYDDNSACKAPCSLEVLTNLVGEA